MMKFSLTFSINSIHLITNMGSPSTVWLHRDLRVSTGDAEDGRGDELSVRLSDFARVLLFGDRFGSQENAVETADEAKIAYGIKKYPYCLSVKKYKVKFCFMARWASMA
jgi:hypothetical protein